MINSHISEKHVLRSELHHNPLSYETVLEWFTISAMSPYKNISCSTQLSMKFSLLIKSKMLKNKDISYCETFR